MVYGTRYGATASTAETIAQDLQRAGYTVKLVDANKERVRDIHDYELIIVGSGVRIGRWTKGPQAGLKYAGKRLSLQAIINVLTGKPSISAKRKRTRRK